MMILEKLYQTLLVAQMWQYLRAFLLGYHTKQSIQLFLEPRDSWISYNIFGVWFGRIWPGDPENGFVQNERILDTRKNGLDPHNTGTRYQV